MTSTRSTLTFRLLRVIGDRPAAVPADAEVFNAPRPLCGTDVDTGLMGISVYLTPDVYGRDRFVDFNLRMDAQVIRWLSRDDALAEAHAYIAAEYGDDIAVEADDDVLLDTWANHFRVGAAEVMA